MLKYSILYLSLALCLISCRQQVKTEQVIDIYSRVKGFNMPKVPEPVIPEYTVNIKDFGAISDGQTINTKAISDAIDNVAGKGGGTVVIPRGLWLTGPILLKSNLNLRAEEGALVIFSSDKKLYPLVQTSFEGDNTVRCISPIYGRDLENISFTGKGIFDGTGEAWRPVKKEKLTESQWKSLLKSGGVLSEDKKIWYPSQSYLEGQKISEMNVPSKLTKPEEFESIKDFLRPVMVSLVNCKKVLFDGPVFQNSPAWCIHPLMCEDVTIRNITVKNPWYSQNGDGIDIESCRNVLLSDSNFDVGDDAICIKSGKDEAGRKRGMPSENMIISNCTVYHGHGGVTVGSEMSGGVRNMYVTGCTFLGTDVGLRFKSNRGRGGIVENLYFTDINMIKIPAQAISFNLYYGGLSPSEANTEGNDEGKGSGPVPPVTEETPVFRNITIKNISCRGAGQALFLQGLPEQNLENITLENIVIEADNGMICTDASGLSIKNLKLVTKKLPAIIISNSQNADIEMTEVPLTTDPYAEITGQKCGNISIRSLHNGDRINAVISKDADAGTIKIL